MEDNPIAASPEKNSAATESGLPVSSGRGEEVSSSCGVSASTSGVEGEEEWVSRWERALARRISGGRVSRPGAVYGLLLRRARRHPLYRRPEMGLSILWLAVPVLTVAGVDSHQFSFGFFSLATWVVMPLWTGIQGFLFMRQMVDSGTLEELILTPLGVKQVVTDIHVFVARKSLAPLVALWVAWVTTVLINTPGRDVVSQTMMSVNILNGMFLMGFGSYLGVRLALGVLRGDVYVRRGLELIRFVALYVLGPILLMVVGVWIALHFGGSAIAPWAMFILFVSGCVLAGFLMARKNSAKEGAPVPPPEDEESKILSALERGRR